MKADGYVVVNDDAYVVGAARVVCNYEEEYKVYFTYEEAAKACRRARKLGDNPDIHVYALVSPRKVRK